jgi:hypothetical protein
MSHLSNGTKNLPQNLVRLSLDQSDDHRHFGKTNQASTDIWLGQSDQSEFITWITEFHCLGRPIRRSQTFWLDQSGVHRHFEKTNQASTDIWVDQSDDHRHFEKTNQASTDILVNQSDDHRHFRKTNQKTTDILGGPIRPIRI